MRQYVVYILDLRRTLTFELYVGGGGILTEFYSQLFILILVRVVCMLEFINLIIVHVINKERSSDHWNFCEQDKRSTRLRHRQDQ